MELEEKRKIQSSREVCWKNKENPEESKSSTRKSTRENKEIYRQKVKKDREIQSWKLSTIKYKRP